MNLVTVHPYPIPVDLLIFDLDGTLADTSQDLTRAVNFMLSQFQKPLVDVKEVISNVGDGLDMLIKRIFGEISDNDLARAKLYFHQYYSQHLLDFTQLYPGMNPVLFHFSDHQLAVLSNKPHVYVQQILNGLNIAHFFSIVIGAQEKFPRKPSAEAIIYLLDQIGVDASSAVIIGDTKNDILAGQEAGIKTCAVSFGFRSQEELMPFAPDFLIDEPLQLIQLFL